MGFDPAKLSGFVSSGEEAFRHIQEHHSGQRCLFFTWERELNEPGASFLEGLDVSSASAASADFILCQGTEVISNGDAVVKTGFLHSGDITPYLAALEAAKARDLEMLVANADLRAMLPSGASGHMPGAIGKAYEQMGGRVRWFGKPHAAHFEACLRLLHPNPRERVVHVGDSLEHDIQGANAAGIDSVFVAAGIHGAQLGLRVSGEGVVAADSAALTEESIAMVVDEEASRGVVSVTPTWACRQFVW